MSRPSPAACIRWTGTRLQNARRFAWRLQFGERLAANVKLEATCRNRKDCIQPAHLREQPPAAQRKPRRLSDAQVKRLRKQHAAGASLTRLAAHFNISLSAASRIVNRSRRSAAR